MVICCEVVEESGAGELRSDSDDNSELSVERVETTIMSYTEQDTLNLIN